MVHMHCVADDHQHTGMNRGKRQLADGHFRYILSSRPRGTIATIKTFAVRVQSSSISNNAPSISISQGDKLGSCHKAPRRHRGRRAAEAEASNFGAYIPSKM